MMDDDTSAFLDLLAQAAIDEDPSALHRLCAPWVCERFPLDELAQRLAAQRAATIANAGLAELGRADGVDIDESLIDYAELAENAVDEGDPLPDEVTAENWLDWLCVTPVVDDGEWSVFDLWVALVRLPDGGVAIGHIRLDDPD
jgi:hypothetical protein